MAGAADEIHIILIRYERLPEFCSACGRVGHDVRHCDDNMIDKQKKPFGVWLKATRTIDGRRGRTAIHRMGEHSVTANSLTPESIPKEMAAVGKGGLVTGKEKVGESVGYGEDVRRDRVERNERREEEEEEGIQSYMDVGEIEGRETGRIEGERTLENMEVGEWMGDKSKEVMVSKSTKSSPMKKTKRGGGKDWKRRAREGTGKKQGGKGEGEGGEMVGVGKRKGGSDLNLEVLAPKAKVCRVSVDGFVSSEPTAAAASQPRRSQ